jgi:2'-5' RNA ligase
MTPDYEALYADHEEQRDHWWWRPGWGVGTRFLTFHITLDEQPDLHDLMDAHASAVSAIPTLDIVPRTWRHITLQGLGHSRELDGAEVDQVCAAVSARLAELPPLTAHFDRAVVFREAVALVPQEPEPFTRVRNAIRAAIAEVRGEASESPDGFRAHATLAYANGRGDRVAIRQALDTVSGTARAAFGHVDLIELHRDNGMYEWAAWRSVALGPQAI